MKRVITLFASLFSYDIYFSYLTAIYYREHLYFIQNKFKNLCTSFFEVSIKYEKYWKKHYKNVWKVRTQTIKVWNFYLNK